MCRLPTTKRARERMGATPPPFWLASQKGGRGEGGRRRRLNAPLSICSTARSSLLASSPPVALCTTSVSGIAATTGMTATTCRAGGADDSSSGGKGEATCDTANTIRQCSASARTR